jgi:hypothetical protein
MNSHKAASTRARRGRIEPDEMTVATIFELSWNPLRRSKRSARARRTGNMVGGGSQA